MIRASWKGTILFGQVSIPVRLYRSSIPHDFQFHLLHAADGGSIQLKRVCSRDGQEISAEQLVKGFKLETGEHVTLTQAELNALEDHGPREIVIEDFVRGTDIDPVLYGQTYYVVPEEQSAHAYAVLMQAMDSSETVAIARITMRLRQHLCAVSISSKCLTLSTLRYADEVVDPFDLDVPELAEDVQPREVQLAERLIEAMTTRFRPYRYRDDYHDEVLGLLRRKAAGQRIRARRHVERVQRGSLAEALSSSLAELERRPGAMSPHTTSRRAVDEAHSPASSAPHLPH